MNKQFAKDYITKALFLLMDKKISQGFENGVSSIYRRNSLYEFIRVR